MTDLELHFKDTDLRETAELESGCKGLPLYIEERLDQIDRGLRTLGGEIGKLAQAVEAINGPPTAHVQQPSERSVADVDNRLSSKWDWSWKWCAKRQRERRAK